MKMKRNLSDMGIRSGSSDKFTADDARSLMLRTEDSILRTIAVGGVLYRVSAVKSFVSRFVLLSSMLSIGIRALLFTVSSTEFIGREIG